MSTRHCTDDVLVAKLYGLDVDSSDALHLNECTACAGRLDAMKRHRQAASEEGVSEDMLRKQRATVYARIEGERRLRFWLRPAPALALLIAAGLMFRPSTPAPAPVQTASAESDAQFFSEIATVVDQEPRAADPIRGLFDEAAAK